MTWVIGVGITAQAQNTPSSTILTVEMQGVVQYQENFANQTKNGTSASMEPSIGAPLTFSTGYFIADIASINGKPCKGATVARNLWFNLNSNPTASQAIADINRFQAMDIVLEIQLADGTSVGSIALTGLTGGAPPPGGPRIAPTGSFAVIGGTGAFLGARGQAATIVQSGRFTSTLENPINRRTFPSGVWRMAIQLIPMQTPAILSDANGPLIVHADDFSPVTAAKPARAGEVLTLFASGLGPTRPGVDPGQTFPESPAQVVSAPVDVVVNGKAGEVLYAGGYAGTTDRYQVNFRMPPDAGPGIATLQLSAFWVAGAEVKLPVQ